MHAPAACLKTPGLFAFSPAELQPFTAAELRESLLSSISVSRVLFFTHSVFLNNLPVFRSPRNEETSSRFLLLDAGENRRCRPWKSDYRAECGARAIATATEVRPPFGGGGNEEGLSKRRQQVVSGNTHTHKHTYSLQMTPEPDSVISQRFSLTPGVSLLPIKFPLNLYVNIRAKKSR